MADEKKLGDPYSPETPEIDIAPPLENPEKSRWERSWPTIACGAGLLSDGKMLCTNQVASGGLDTLPSNGNTC